MILGLFFLNPFYSDLTSQVSYFLHGLSGMGDILLKD